jgi:hypothetical protein
MAERSDIRVEKKLDPEFAARICKFKELLESRDTEKILTYDELLEDIDFIFFEDMGQQDLSDENTQLKIRRLIFGNKKITIEDNLQSKRPGQPSEHCVSIYGGDILNPDSGLEICVDRLKGGGEQLNSIIITAALRAVTFSYPERIINK